MAFARLVCEHLTVQSRHDKRPFHHQFPRRALGDPSVTIWASTRGVGASLGKCRICPGNHLAIIIHYLSLAHPKGGI